MVRSEQGDVGERRRGMWDSHLFPLRALAARPLTNNEAVSEAAVETHTHSRSSTHLYLSSQLKREKTTTDSCTTIYEAPIYYTATKRYKLLLDPQKL